MAHRDLRGSLFSLNLEQFPSDESLSRIEAIMAEIAEEAGITSGEVFLPSDDPQGQGTLVYDKFKSHGR